MLIQIHSPFTQPRFITPREEYSVCPMTIDVFHMLVLVHCQKPSELLLLMTWATIMHHLSDFATRLCFRLNDRPSETHHMQQR
ncbi:Uncharacterized protein HZ326_5427 [Fusarium oxysporum f. sp. albedinis]|nr:Uncharacterized protein HZ326_5427 [Fusarium oxysporum f. sp. albedinis]